MERKRERKKSERVSAIPEFSHAFPSTLPLSTERVVLEEEEEEEDQGSRIHPRDFPGKTFTRARETETRDARRLLFAANDHP